MFRDKIKLSYALPLAGEISFKALVFLGDFVVADETQHKYKWDVAISLLDRDLSFAQSLCNGLKDRFRVFLYSEEHKELQFNDGLEVFSDIFRRDARVVTVLWREEWATTKWTTIEQRAIKDRVFEEGPEFLALVKMEQGITPSWVPQTYIYRQQKGWDLSTLIENVAGQVNRLGGEIRRLTPLEIAQRQRKESEWAETHMRLLTGVDAQQAINRELEALGNQFKEQIEALNGELSRRELEFESGFNALAVLKNPCSVTMQTGTNTQNLPYVYRLYLTFYDGMVSVIGSRVNHSRPAKLKEAEYAIDCDAEGNWFWTELKSKRALSTPTLVEEVLTHLLNRSHAIQTGQTKRKEGESRDPFDDDDNFWPSGGYKRF